MAKKKIEEYVAVGRRKTAVASVRIRPEGSGKIDVNGRKLEDYFPLAMQRQTIMAPVDKAGGPQKYDIIIRVNGGGIEAQAVAVRHGISRALVSGLEDLHADFKALGYLTRDSRKKERKKYGLAGARKRFQFSKR